MKKLQAQLICSLFIVNSANLTAQPLEILPQSPITKYGILLSIAPAGKILSSQYLQSTVTTNVACPSGLNNAYPKLCAVNKYYLNNDPIFGLSKTRNIDNFVVASKIPSVGRVIVTYTSPGLHTVGTSIPTVATSGLILVPNVAVSAIKGVILYFHPTVITKCGIPSGINNAGNNACNKKTQKTQEQLAATYAMAGYIVLAPDYLGQGLNSDVLHSHNFYAKQQAASGLYMLSAARTYLQQQGINLQETSLIIAGFSEGGNYALWASYLAQTKFSNLLDNVKLELKHTFGMEGIYDYSGVMLNFFFANVTNDATATGSNENNIYNLSPGCISTASPSSASVCGARGILSERHAKSLSLIQMSLGKDYFAVDLNTYIKYSGTNKPYSYFMRKEFVDQKECIDYKRLTSTRRNYFYHPCAKIMAHFGGVGAYTLPELFYNNGLSGGQISAQLKGASVGSSAGKQFIIGGLKNYVQVLAAETSGKTFNSVESFVHKKILNDASFLQEVGATDSYAGKTTSPVTLLYLRYDQIVSNKNAAAACNPNSPSLLTNSAQGLVTCLQDPGISGSAEYPQTNGVNNTNLWDLSTGAPLYLFHSNFEAMAQLISLQQLISK